MKDEEKEKSIPLSAYLEGFDRQRVRGAVLSGIHLENGKKTFTLEGIAQEAHLVPHMIQFSLETNLRF